MRFLGFSGKILSTPALSTYDARPINQRPHLSISLLYLRDVLEHLYTHRIHLYRLPHQFAPYFTHPERRWFHHQLEECADELAYLRESIVRQRVRLSLHLPLSFDLCTTDETTQYHIIESIEKQACLLHALGGSESILVAHLGGQRDSGRAALEQSCRLIDELSPLARQLLALEHDDQRWCLEDLWLVYEQTQTPLIFDLQHYYLNNPQHTELDGALNLALRTWPRERYPKIHLSSPRTELRIRNTGQPQPRLQAPRWNEHSDYLHPWEMIQLLQIPATRDYDVMIEAKAGDLALFRAREALERFAPELRETHYEL